MCFVLRILPLVSRSRRKQCLLIWRSVSQIWLTVKMLWRLRQSIEIWLSGWIIMFGVQRRTERIHFAVDFEPMKLLANRIVHIHLAEQNQNNNNVLGASGAVNSDQIKGLPTDRIFFTRCISPATQPFFPAYALATAFPSSRNCLSGTRHNSLQSESIFRIQCNYYRGCETTLRVCAKTLSLSIPNQFF